MWLSIPISEHRFVPGESELSMSICSSRMTELEVWIEVADIPRRHAFPDGRVEGIVLPQSGEAVQHF